MTANDDHDVHAGGHWWRREIPRIALFLVLLLTGVAITRAAAPSIRWPWTASPPKVTHAMVAMRVQDVAKLVSTELTLRDVVTYEQSRFGMHRRGLYVVTGKVLAGIDLTSGVEVKIDDATKRITIGLPRATILAVDVLETKTYDESSGLLFPFKPEDRDLIQRRIREQLHAAGEQSGLLPQADRSARQILSSLLSKDGYAVDVTTRTQLARPPAG